MPILVPERQVAPSAPRPVFQSVQGAGDPRSFGVGPDTSGLTAGIERAADKIQETVLKEAHENNVREAKNLDNSLSETLRKIQYGDGTADNPGFLSTKGEDALKASKDAEEAIRKAKLDVAGSTTNKRAQTLYDAMANQRIEQELKVLSRHVQTERQSAENTTSAARIAAAANDAAANYLDEDVLQRSYSIVVGEATDRAKRLGLSGDVVKAQVTAAKSAVVSGAVKSALAAEDVVTANKLMEKYGGDITANDRAVLTNGLRTASVTKQAQGLRDAAMAKFPGNLEAQIKWVMDNSEGKVEDEAFQQITKVFGVSQSVKDRARADFLFEQGQQDRTRSQGRQEKTDARSDLLFEQGQQDRTRNQGRQEKADERSDFLFVQGQNDRITNQQRQQEADERAREAERRARDSEAQRLLEIEHTKRERARQEAERQAYQDAYTAVNGGTSYDKLPLAQRLLLNTTQENHLKTLEKQRASGQAIVTDYDYYGKVTNLPPGSAELANVDLAEARTKLADTQFARVETLVTAARQQKADPNSTVSAQALFNQRANKLGLTGPDKQAERGKLGDMYLEAVANARQAKGKALTDKEELDILNGLTDKVVLDSSILGIPTGTKETPLYKVAVPADARATILEQYRRVNITPTEAMISQSYVQMQAAERKKKQEKK